MRKIAGFFSMENRTLIIILSVLAALVICFLADPIVEVTYTVDLQYVNQETLADMQLALTDSSSYTSTISVTVVGRRSKVESITSADLAAVADFSNIKTDGSITLDKPEITSSGHIYVLSYSPEVVYRNIVSTNQLPAKTYNIVTHIQSNIIDEYELIHYSMSDSSISTQAIYAELDKQGQLTTEQINTLINAISKVEANIVVTDRIEPYTDSVALTFLDKDGNEISTLSDTCYMNVDVIIGKRLSVELQFAGRLEEGYYIESATASPLAVALYSLTNPGYLATLDSVVVTEVVQLEGKNSTFATKVSLILPDEVIVFGNDSKTVNAIIQIGKYESMNISLDTGSDNISFDNSNPNYTYSITNRTPLILYGSEENLAKVTLSKLQFHVDVEELTEGDHVCEVTVTGLPEGVVLADDSTIGVTVRR